MPKFPKPFYREDRRRWYVQLGTRQVNLGPDEAAAHARYHEVMADRHKPARLPDDPLVCEVLDRFLAWCQANRSPRTYDGHSYFLHKFVRALPDPKGMPVSALKAHHLEGWVTANPQWQQTARRNATASVQRAFSWAVKAGHLDRSSVAGVAKPQAARNRKAVTPDQYQSLLAAATKPAHRDALVVLWETGMRPQEFRILEAGHARLGEERLLIPAEQAKGRRHDREVLLTAAAVDVVRRAVEAHPTGPLFRNLRGRAWTNYGLNCLFQRLSGRAGVHASPYLLRHGFATRLLKARAGVAEVAALMGHRDPTMTLKVYQHVGDDKPHLRQALNRA